MLPNFSCLASIRRLHPLIHCISNLVTANDCANLAYALGASPIMAHAPQEAETITAAAAVTILNTGTPARDKFRACLLAGAEAARLGHPIVLDPVGAGASAWRLDAVNQLLERFTPTILRVNLAEAQALCGGFGREHGVDSPAAPQTQRLDAALHLARRFGGKTAVLLSGPEDLITDGETVWSVSGGSELMTRITGTGCMLSVLCGVFSAAEEAPLDAALLASIFWKICAEKAAEASRAPGSFRVALMDAAGTLTPADCAQASRLRRIL
ncbi:MAG: hydroxyethylthiazole kinase [Oscillibacter sp.]|nr:hydroxyethylthiazole kinase [Oscillibacter sp.]